MIGRKLLHYEVESELGAGGMGRVYLARDTRADRRVALKFIAEDATPEARERLLREARAAARLTHPGIVTLYAIEESSEGPFLVQEYVAGESLARRLARGPLGTRETLKLARELTDALAHAHRHGVVHRDLKPDNVLMAPDGSAKIADFGLARLEGAATLTEAGQLLGTLPYLAPERLAGNAGDARADLFALGAILYEAITGRRAFPGSSESAVMYAVMNETPPAPAVTGALQPVVPLVMKLLAKDPADRPASAEVVRGVFEMLAMTAPMPPGSGAPTAPAAGQAPVPTSAVTAPLPHAGADAPPPGPAPSPHARHWLPVAAAALGLIAVALVLWLARDRAVPEASAESPAVAVLYFENVPDPADAGRMGSITGNLLVTALAQAPDVNVLSTQRVLDAIRAVGGRSGELDPARALAVARRARATRIVTGRILQVQPAIVMTAEVVDVATGRVVHAERVEGRPGQTVFQLVDELGPRLLAGMLRRDRGSMSLPNLASRTSSSLAAQHHYAAGLEWFGEARLDSAEVRFAAAVAEDPTFAQAHYQLAITQWWGQEHVQSRQSIQHAREGAARLSEVERGILEGIASLTSMDFGDARRKFDALAVEYPEEKLVRYGQLEATYHGGDHIAAIAAARACLALDPEFRIASIHLMDALAHTGRTGEGRAMARELMQAGAQGQVQRSIATLYFQSDAAPELLELVRPRRRGNLDPTVAGFLGMWVLMNQGPDSAAAWFDAAGSVVAPAERSGTAEYVVAAREGRMRDAIAIARRVWGRLEPKAPYAPTVPFIANGILAAAAIGDEATRDELAGYAAKGIGAFAPVADFGVLPSLHRIESLIERGRVDAADSLMQSLTRASAGRNATTLRLLEYGHALVLAARGRTDEALSRLHDAEPPAGPFHDPANRRFDRARILQRGGRHADALAVLDSLGGAPLFPERQARIPLLRASSREALGRHGEAKVQLDAWFAAHRRADKDLLDLATARALRARLERSGSAAGRAAP